MTSVLSPETYSIIHNICLRDKIARQCLEVQKDMLNKEILINHHMVKCCMKKIEILDKKTPLVEKQLSEFIPDRHDEINRLAESISTLDKPTKAFVRWMKERKSLQDQLHQLLKNISHLEKNIPSVATATTYTVKPKFDSS